MSIVRQWYGTGLTDPTTVTTSTAGSGDNAFSAVTGAPQFTGGGILFPADTTTRYCSWTGLALTDLCVRVYIKAGTTGATVPLIQGLTSVPAQVFAVGINGSNQFVLRNASNSGIKNSTAYNATHDYVLEVRYSTAGSAYVRVIDLADGSTFWSDGGAVGSTATVDRIYVGRNAGTAAGPFTFSKIKVGNVNAFIGPDNDTPPSVSITAAQTAAASATVSATVTASDLDGISSYAWTITRYSASAAPATITPTSGATAATCTWTSGAAGTLDVASCVVTDNGSPQLSTTATTEVRVPVTTSGGTATPTALWGYTPVTSGTWTRTGGSSDGEALGDASDSTYVASGTVSGTAQTHRHRLQPCPAGLTAITLTERCQTDTGSATATAVLYEGTTARATGTPTSVGTTATDVTVTLSPASSVTDPGNLWGSIGGTS